jgi:hypothetical protein
MEELDQTTEELELRMYFFVPYNISPIQQAIQAGHAALRYALQFGRNNPDHSIWDFIINHKTWVILDGGTTNSERDHNLIVAGTLNQIGGGLNHNGVDFSFFHEPDLNYALTAVCFICDERVFNKKDYPDFLDYVYEKNEPLDEVAKLRLRMKTIEDLQEEYNSLYKEWVRLVGGVKNVYLRELLKGKKKA